MVHTSQKSSTHNRVWSILTGGTECSEATLKRHLLPVGRWCLRGKLKGEWKFIKWSWWGKGRWFQEEELAHGKPGNEKGCAKLESLTLFKETKAYSVKSETLSLGFCTCSVTLGTVPDLGKLFKPLSLTCMVEMMISSSQSCPKSEYMSVSVYLIYKITFKTLEMY